MKPVLERVKALKDLPCGGQGLSQVSTWFESTAHTPGDVIVVRHTQNGVWRYELDEIKVTDHTKQRRVVLKQNGSFYRDGKNCFQPTGQTRFIEPTPAVLIAANEGTHYQFDGRPQD